MSFECGDKVIDIRYGKGTVCSINRKYDFPVFVKFEKNNKVCEYTKEGRFLMEDEYPTLYHAEGFTLPSCSEPERKPKCDFQPYDKVLVNKGKECPWCLAFFAHYDLDSEHFPYTTLHGEHWMNCIPFEGNETKLGDLAE